ncbi:hypothetical protein [Legionella bozemanae]|nr:hypothetical protein [Legionella bozemanae]
MSFTYCCICIVLCNITVVLTLAPMERAVIRQARVGVSYFVRAGL